MDKRHSISLNDTEARFIEDASDAQTVAAKYADATSANTATKGWSMCAAVAGDINGDGLDDVLLANSRFIEFKTLPATIGRAYVVFGQQDPQSANAAYRNIDLATESGLILEDFALGGSIAALGDINQDGYDDFAVSRTAEGRNAGPSDPTREGGLFVFYGKAGFGTAGSPVKPDVANITVRRYAEQAIPEGVAYDGELYATAGDFNADGRQDLLVTEPLRELRAKNSSTVLSQDRRGAAYVLYKIAERGADAALTGADITLRGESEFDRFGTLPQQPGMDLDGDGFDDLLAGAPGADRVNPLTADAGKLYVAYGAAPKPQTSQLGSIEILFESARDRQRRFPGGSQHWRGGSIQKLRRHIGLHSCPGYGIPLVQLHHAGRWPARRLYSHHAGSARRFPGAGRSGRQQ